MGKRTKAKPVKLPLLTAVPSTPKLNTSNTSSKKTDAPVAEDKGYRISVRKDVVDYPELWLEVFVAGPKWEERAFAEMLVRSNCTRAPSPEDADLVIFVGGDDVNPLLYGEKAHPNTVFDPARDAQDIELFDYCYKNGIPMLGVCRGAQFGHAMLGGKLYQHVDNHNGSHNMWDIRNNKHIANISSVHHQMCIENVEGGMTILGDCYKSRERWLNDQDKDDEVGHRDIEAFFYRDACFIGVQGHPEYSGYSLYTKWCLDLINEFVNENVDVTLKGNYRRLKDDFLAMRQSVLADKVLEELS